MTTENEVHITNAQKILETRFNKRVQDQMVKEIKEKRMSPKKRPLEGTHITDHNSFVVLGVENIAEIAWRGGGEF
jgi:hypothetical protein